MFKKSKASWFILLVLVLNSMKAQEIIDLPQEHTGELFWEQQERQYYSNIWETEVVTNVSKPRLQVFRPKEEQNNGAAVIIAPGGALYALSIESEGNMVTKWLADKGFTAFVLNHLVPITDAVAKFLNYRKPIRKK